MSYNVGAQQIGRIRSRRRHERYLRDLDAFADLLAEEVDVAAAAQQLGHPVSWGRSALRRIRGQLGPWAV